MTVLACIAWTTSCAVGQDLGLTNTLENPFADTSVASATETGDESLSGDVAPLPISEPAPLDVDSEDGVLGAALRSETEGTADEEGKDPPADAEIEVIRERYPNRTVKIEREVTQDAEGNYVNHGSWKQWDEGGNLVAEGRYYMGTRSGRWTQWHTRRNSELFNTLPFTQSRPPFISQATFENDMLHGDWTIYDADQRRLSRISFQNGLRHGPATLWLPTGQVIRQMNFLNGELDGDVMEVDKEGQLVKTATFKQGRRFAEKVTYFNGSRNRQTQAQYLFAKLVPKTADDFWNARFADYEAVGQDERHGEWTTWYENGQVQIQGEYSNDLEVGQFTWWHSNGQKYSQGEYVDGQQHGTWRWWHQNGQKWTEGEFNHGEQTGEWSSWTESGRLDQQAAYSGSRPHTAPEAHVEAEQAQQSSRRLQ